MSHSGNRSPDFICGETEAGIVKEVVVILHFLDVVLSLSSFPIEVDDSLGIHLVFSNVGSEAVVVVVILVLEEEVFTPFLNGAYNDDPVDFDSFFRMVQGRSDFAFSVVIEAYLVFFVFGFLPILDIGKQRL